MRAMLAPTRTRVTRATARRRRSRTKGPRMSENSTGYDLDRRVRRTRDRLGDALVDLMQERPFDAITVQAVLDRAGVSRSTFYEHFRDKDDLFLSDVDDFFAYVTRLLEHETTPTRRLFPV